MLKVCCKFVDEISLIIAELTYLIQWIYKSLIIWRRMFLNVFAALIIRLVIAQVQRCDHPDDTVKIT